MTDILVIAALGVLIVLVTVLLLRQRSPQPVGEIKASLQGIQEAKDVISDHAVRTIQSINELGESLHSLVRQQEDAQKLGQSLKDLLQAPKLRGSYGETVLEEMLDRVIPKGMWERQYVVDGRETVDCVIKYRDVVVPIDAKFPRDDYLRYLDAPTPEAKAACWKDFERSVKAKVTSIASKYVKPEKGTSDFALMFIPSEAIYYETIAEKNHLGEPSTILEFAQEHHVLPVGPNTFYAFLQVILLGIRNVAMVTTAKKLQEDLAGLQRSFQQFYAKYQETGKELERAAEAYRVGVGHVDRYKRRLDSVLQLEALQGEEKPQAPNAKEGQ